MAAKKIKRAPKDDTRHNTGDVLPEPKRQASIVAIPVANGCTVLTTPNRVEKVKSRYKYLTEFKD